MRAAAAGVVAMGILAGCGGGRARPDTGPATRPQSSNTATSDDFGGQQPSARRAEDLFQGRFPGVNVQSAQGGVTITIRGTPASLYLIDGQPVNAGTGGLVSINPSDIARVDVVKDAAELAMYGSRAGSGVIRITTKRASRRS